MSGTIYSVGGPFSTYETPADIPATVFSEEGNTLEIYPGTHTWPSTDFDMNNTTIVGIGGKDACILTGSINGSTASQGENFISGLTINGTASVPAIDMKATAQRCQAAAIVVGTADLVYAAANAGNMTETVTARTIVS